MMREVLESGEEDVAKYAEVFAASKAVGRELNKKMRELKHGESFQCSECGDLFLATMVKWGAFLEQVKENHPGAKKPQRSECLVDVDGNVKPSGQKHNQFRCGGGFKPKRHVDQAGNGKLDAKPVGPQWFSADRSTKMVSVLRTTR